MRPAIVIQVELENLRPFNFAETFPAFSEIIASLDGHLWVRTHPSGDPLSCPEGVLHVSFGRGSCDTFDVFSPEGSWLGLVHVPEQLTVFEIGSDYLLGSEPGEFDVEYVVLYRIVRLPASA